MISLIIMGALGMVALRGDYTSVTQFLKAQQSAFLDGTVLVEPKPSKSRYLENGPKEIIWGPAEEAPVRIAPEAPKTVIAKKPAKKQVVAVVETSPAPKLEAPIEETKDADDADDLGLLDNKKPNIGVSTDEILSYFEKKGAKNVTHDEPGSFVIPNSTAAPVAPKSRADYELH